MCFHLSPLQLHEAESVYLPVSPTNSYLMRTEAQVQLRLQSSHFRTMDQRRELVLRCTAQIGNFYYVYTEMALGTSSKDPRPERGE